MEVEPDGQREATVPGRTEPDARGDARISGIQVASAGHPQQRGLETRSVADGEQLLRIAARTAIAAQFDGDGQLHVKPAGRWYGRGRRGRLRRSPRRCREPCPCGLLSSILALNGQCCPIISGSELFGSAKPRNGEVSQFGTATPSPP